MGAPDDRARHLLAQALTKGEPTPTDDSTESLMAWLASPGPHDPPGIGRYLTQIWRERTDLQEVFPGLFLDAEQRGRFLLWAHHFAAGEAAMPDALVPAPPPGVTELAAPILDGEPPSLRHGTTIVGYLRAVLGLGGSARRLAHLAELAGEHVVARSYDHIGSPLDHPWPDADTGPGSDTDTAVGSETHPRGDSGGDRNDIVVLCVNGSETARLSRALGAGALHGRYRIGLWFWELEVLPPSMAEGFAHLDEVWVTSEYVRAAVAAAAPAGFAVHVIPLGTELATTEETSGAGISRDALGLPPAGMLLGISFDYASRIERKNPAGLIAAFRQAFPEPFSLGPERGPWLVLKTLNGELHRDDAATVRQAATAAGPDVLVIDRQFTFAEQRALLRELDVVVSLHRSEGYGNSLLEAMGHAHPVIATGWSGNREFMDETNSWLVPYRFTAVPAGSAIYPEGLRWADPDVGVAAEMMRTVVAGLDRDGEEAHASVEVRRRAQRGAADVAAINDGSAGAAFIRQRLAAIRAARVDGAGGASGS